MNSSWRTELEKLYQKFGQPFENVDCPGKTWTAQPITKKAVDRVIVILERLEAENLPLPEDLFICPEEEGESAVTISYDGFSEVYVSSDEMHGCLDFRGVESPWYDYMTEDQFVEVVRFLNG